MTRKQSSVAAALLAVCASLPFVPADADEGALGSLRDTAGSIGVPAAPRPAVEPAAAAALPAEDPAAAYASLYASGRAPQPAELTGDWKGAAVVLADLKPLPRAPLLERFIQDVGLAFWNGKTFAAAGGFNRFLGGRLKLFRFADAVRPSRTGTGDALALDYSRNPYPISAVRDEVRLLPDGRLLGRAYMHAPNGRDYFLFFFLLEKSAEKQ